jgi:hypothetical protein
MAKVLFMALSAVIATVSTGGCSAIGYVVGGTIDPIRYSVDSLSAPAMADSAAGVSQAAWDLQRARLEWLLGKTSPVEGPIPVSVHPGGSMPGTLLPGEVEILSGFVAGDFQCGGVRFDSVFAPVWKPSCLPDERFVPGKQVRLVPADSSAASTSGVLKELTRKIVIIGEGGRDRWFRVDALDSVVASDGSGFRARELSTGSLTLVNVPGVILQEHDRTTFIPLCEIDKIRVSSRVRWGPTRKALYGLGAAFDMGSMFALIRHPMDGPEKGVAEATVLTLLWGGCILLIPYL